MSIMKKLCGCRYGLRRVAAAVAAVVAGTLGAWSQYELDYRVSFTGNAGSGDFAPYYMMSNVHGVLTQPYSAMLRASVEREMDTSSRFSYGFGIDVVGGYSSKTTYRRYNLPTGEWLPNEQGPAPVWLQQLYGEVKYRCLFISLGMKERGSVFVNDELSSGDMTYSANARPIPGVRMGFVDFQDIPFTKGWVQIRGELSYGMSMSSDWLENHYNYYSGKITTDEWYCYKYLHFRTDPDKPFSFLVGMQSTCQFGGKYHIYFGGSEAVDRHKDMTPSAGSFFKAIIPMVGNSTYYEGNHLGTWDVMGRYRFRDGRELKVYYQSPWEDGSGIGKLNGFDGMYGIEFCNNRHGIVEGAVIEYIDLTNQSGPLHWAPGQFDLGYLIPNEATGGDDYYNNTDYNGYQLYGQSIGSPFMKSPIYNTDGYMQFTDNRIRGFHIGVTGHLSDSFGYRLMASYRKSWGTSLAPSLEKTHATSFSIEGRYDVKCVPGLSVKAQLALDRGTLLGDNFGGLVTVSYDGLFKL